MRVWSSVGGFGLWKRSAMWVAAGRGLYWLWKVEDTKGGMGQPMVQFPGRETVGESARAGFQGLSSARKYTQRAVGEGLAKVWEVTEPWEGMTASISESQFDRSVDQARR